MRHTGALDVAIVGSTAEALLCASSISQLDIVTVKVFSCTQNANAGISTMDLSLGSLNAIHAISPQLCRAVISAGQPLQSTPDSTGMCIRGAPLPHTPAARGIQAGARIQQAALTDLLSAALPSGMLQQGMHFSGVQEEVDGVKLSFQAAEAVQAKLVVVCGDAAASVARTVGPGQPWGRGRIAVIPKAADGQVNAEATVELAYSLSEHGLTPAAFRAFAIAMERIQDTQQQRALPPVAQPEALKGSASSSMGSSPCGSLKMQELRPFEPAGGLQNSAA
ncbi:g10815 [Coccomyxa viridis]|uniref:G10815 protein n=1 Tax=Coccomyxa viridis TaxID=1274662 RepID=A0ABP1GAV0_9CHLO